MTALTPTRPCSPGDLAPVETISLAAPRVPSLDLHEIHWLGSASAKTGPFASAEAAVSWADDQGLSTDDGYVLRDDTGERVATVEEFGARYPGVVTVREVRL